MRGGGAAEAAERGREMGGHVGRRAGTLSAKVQEARRRRRRRGRAPLTDALAHVGQAGHEEEVVGDEGREELQAARWREGEGGGLGQNA